MNDMNIEKNTTVFSQRFPEECEKHFNLLAKKRFKRGGGPQEISAVAPAAAANSKEETEEGKKARQKKSVLARRLEEKMSANAAGKSEEELLQEVVAELKAKEHKGGGATLGLTSHTSFYFIFVIIFMRQKVIAWTVCSTMATVGTHEKVHVPVPVHSLSTGTVHQTLW